MLTSANAGLSSLELIAGRLAPGTQAPMSLTSRKLQSLFRAPKRFSLNRVLPHILNRESDIFNTRIFSSSRPVMSKQKVIVISGPTASGKTNLGLHLATLLNGEVISADSVQVYEGLDVGSAKTPESERQGVRHHLLDILHPREEYTAGDFFEDARAATQDILQRGKVPVVVGGTGLYLRWYLYGKPDTPRATPEVVAAVEGEIQEAMGMGDRGWEAALKVLKQAGDVETGQQLARNDWYRLKRALEIIKASGRPRTSFALPSKAGLAAACSDTPSNFLGHVTELAHGAEKAVSRDDSVSLKSQQYQAASDEVSAEQPDSKPDSVPHSGLASPGVPPEPSGNTVDLDFDFRCYFLSAPRVDLYHRIDKRCEEMIKGGMLQEADWMLREGVEPGSNPASRAIGYRQAIDFLLSCRRHEGKSSKEELLEFINACQQASRNYAKRQLVWFRAEKMYCWLDASLSTLELAEQIVEDLQQPFHSWRDRKADSNAAAREEAARQASYDDGKIMKHYRTKLEIFNNEHEVNKVLQWLEATQV